MRFQQKEHFNAIMNVSITQDEMEDFVLRVISWRAIEGQSLLFSFREMLNSLGWDNLIMNIYLFSRHGEQLRKPSQQLRFA